MARPVFYTPVKRNHVIAPFGVGAVLLARNGVSVVVCGLDEWLHARPDHPRGVGHWLDANRVVDRNLEARLGVSRLVRPPAVAEDPTHHNTWFLRVARFPSWEYCINPKCRRMVRRDPDDVASGRCATCGGQGRKRGQWPTQQTPLVLACSDGHLSDVPWVDWVHTPALRRDADDAHDPDACEPRVCGQPQLTYRVASDITAPVVACDTCKAEIDLGALRARRQSCPGDRPWLPGSAAHPCGAGAQLLERTSTNLYFADVRSSLHLPLGPALDHRLTALLQEPVAQLLIRSHAPRRGRPRRRHRRPLPGRRRPRHQHRHWDHGRPRRRPGPTANRSRRRRPQPGTRRPPRGHRHDAGQEPLAFGGGRRCGVAGFVAAVQDVGRGPGNGREVIDGADLGEAFAVALLSFGQASAEFGCGVGCRLGGGGAQTVGAHDDAFAVTGQHDHVARFGSRHLGLLRLR